MAIMIDEIPEFQGEASVWDAFHEYLDEDVIVYHNREVNGREFDFCVLLPYKGILIVEVKGWQAHQVHVSGVNNIKVDGFNTVLKSPKQQARGYRFDLLNKIKDNFNSNPLVFDMVCYPFISRDEFYNCQLNIVCEEEYVLFKEDLETKDRLNNKISAVLNKYANLGYHAFDDELMTKVRRIFEPEENIKVKERSCPYSKLSIVDQLRETDMELFLDYYFSGTKQIIFIQNKNDYMNIIDRIEKRLNEYGISVDGSNLKIGADNDLSSFKQKNEFRIFNFEIYVFENDGSFKPLSVVDGELCDEDRDEVEKLSNITSFNYQQYIIEHADSEKNVLVEAGAGTGKTYSMISRIMYLCNKGENAITNLAEELAMVTFTNDAADNMKIRLKKAFMNYVILTGKEKYHGFIRDVDRANISTIHKFTISILQKLSLYTGLGSQFSISTDQYKRKQIYDQNIDAFLKSKIESNEDFTRSIPVPLYEIKEKLMKLANTLLVKSVDIEEIKEVELGRNNDFLPYFNELIMQVMIPSEKEYFEYMHTMNKIDLIECIILLNSILRKNKDLVLKEYKIDYLFIDEFQDTDEIQIDLFVKLQKIIGNNCKVFVVGDLKQSIYRFRGATLSAFKRLVDFQKEWNTFYLNRNYRTDNRLLQKYDTIFYGIGQEGYLPYKEEDRLTSRKQLDVDDDEVYKRIVVKPDSSNKKINEILEDELFKEVKHQMNLINESKKKRKMTEEEQTIAILVRSNFEVGKVHMAGAERNINVEITAGGDLFRIDSTIDLYKLLLAVINKNNPLYLLNLIHSNYINVQFDETVLRSNTEEENEKILTDVLNKYFVMCTGKDWNSFLEEIIDEPALYALKKLFDSLKPWKKYSNNKYKQQSYIVNYECLIEDILKSNPVDFLSLNNILEYLKINITTGQEKDSRKLYDNDKNNIKIICSTIHKSKGLEYGTVILPYTNTLISESRMNKFNAGYYNSKLSYYISFDKSGSAYNNYYEDEREVNEQIGEESRILYVALTRAIRNFIWFDIEDRQSGLCWASQMGGE